MAKPQTPTKPPQPTVEAFDIESLKDLTTPLAEAQAAIADLERQREAVNHRRAEHDAERQRIAFAARAQSDQAASKRLSEMITEAIRFDHAIWARPPQLAASSFLLLSRMRRSSPFNCVSVDDANVRGVDRFCPGRRRQRREQGGDDGGPFHVSVLVRV
jgi:hypothetical protein